MKEMFKEHYTKKRSFPLRISLVNVNTFSMENFIFGAVAVIRKLISK